MDKLITYIVINGKRAYIRKFINDDKAKEFCTNYMDHSKYVSYYKIDCIDVELNHLAQIIDIP